MSVKPKNKQLYHAIERRLDPNVRIANEGEDAYFSTPDARGRKYLLHAGEQYVVNCPFCNDTRQRLSINHLFGSSDGPDRRLWLAHCHNEDCFPDFENRKKLYEIIYPFDYGRRRLQDEQVVVSVNPAEPLTLDKVQLPGGCIPITQLPQGHPAREYMMTERRYSPQILDRYQISYCDDALQEFPLAQNRIVFPIHMHGELVGWQCRYLGTADWKRIPKYYGLPGMKKRAMLYNFDFAKRFPYVVVVEGPTDSNVVGDASVAIMGKSLSGHQKPLLMTHWDHKPIIFMLDPDARDKSRATVEDMLRTGLNPIVNIELPDGYDPADYGREAIWNLIHATCARAGLRLV